MQSATAAVPIVINHISIKMPFGILEKTV